MPKQLFRLLTASQATILVPCLPAARATILARLREALGAWARLHEFNTDDAFFAQVDEVLRQRLETGFAQSANNKLLIRWGATPPGQQLELSITVEESEPRQALAGGDAFGKHPDARALELAPAEPRLQVVDLGSGPGRNALGLARRGHPVLALDSEPGYVRRLTLQKRLEGLPIEARQADLRQPGWPVDEASCDLALAVGLLPHMRGLPDVQLLLTEAARLVKPGGKLLLNAFLQDPGFATDALTQEMAQAVWSFFCTREELELMLGSEWELEDVQEAVPYERARASGDTWPPTVWFEPWAEGRNLFPQAPLPPIRLFWVVLRRR